MNKKIIITLTVLWFGARQLALAADPPEWLYTGKGNFTNNVARPLRYWPVGTDFVITNGTEFFNRPLYCLNSAFRIDGGDKPEFSLYLPGRGGNLRFGIKTDTGVKWLNDADQIVARYRAGSMVYQIHDRLLGAGELDLTALPLSETKGLIARAELRGTKTPVKLITAFGGANGMRGKRGGDIGCESEPVSELFQLRAEECKGAQFSIVTNTFTLHGKAVTIAGIFPPDSNLKIADAGEWNSPNDLNFSTNAQTEQPIVIGETELPNDQSVYLALAQTSSNSPTLFSAAENHRRAIAEMVTVETPDDFINAAVPALNIAADAIWDSSQQAYMHGAVAWRMRLLGWRGPYAGDELGHPERTAAHFAGFAREQNTNPIPASVPSPDENSNLARNETALHSNGDLTKAHYDMNLVGVDAFFRHLLWMGDTNFARAMWPVIERHLAWEQRLFRREFSETGGEEKLPLYEAYAAIWASDNLNYNGGGTAHASAYNYYENKMAARVATMLGKDATPYEREADLILRGMNQFLWLTNSGNFAESKDWLGLQLTHPDAGLWTFYNTLDSEVPSPKQAAQMADWIDTHIARIPICGPNVPDENLFTLPETGWLPYQWSLNNVVMAEAAHTALGFWQANRPETAFALFKGELLDSMFLGLCPGNLGAMTSHDMARGEAQRDFGDAIGINSRALVEGLFGVKPDALAGELKIVPGFPTNWNFAKIQHPDFAFDFHRAGLIETFLIEPKFPRPMRLNLQIVALRTAPEITINGDAAQWHWREDDFGVPRIEIDSPAAAKYMVAVNWQGEIPQAKTAPEIQAVSSKNNITFDWNWKISDADKFETVDLKPFFNDRVTQIFQNEYRSPRSPFCSLAMPAQGLGGWSDNNAQFTVDDSGLCAIATQNDGKLILPDGLAFATPTNADDKNIIFTSQWDNYPREVSVPLSGKSAHAFLFMAGSTGPMQSQFDNGEVIVAYADGTMEKLRLQNPTNWWPIDQDYFLDDFAFRRPEAIPPRVDLKTGKIRILDPKTFAGKGGKISGGAATVLDLPLDKTKELKSLTIHTLANEVVIGLMAATLERE